jgi:raffinose/stachyose/melibiose transport system permease protein/N-acetylglucosamine transport system permease protein
MLKEKFTLANIFWRLALIIWAICILLPLVFILIQAFKTNQEFFMGVWTLPKKLQWVNFLDAWNQLGIGKSMLNTLYYVGGSLFVGLFLISLNAYALTRIQWKLRKYVWALIMLSLFLPGINALVPQFVLMRTLHLTNSIPGLIILSSLGESAFNLMLLGGFMQSIPKELEESADMDGASIFKIYRSIVMPLAVPGLVTVGIFRFLGLYNNFIGPYIYLSDSTKWTIGVTMYKANALMQYKADWVTLCAGVIISMIPTLVVYMFFQNRIVEGATIGSMKG